MDDRVRQLARERAGLCCEYCRLPQTAASSIQFHIEHIRPRQHGGSDQTDNLALACPNCNWNKGPNMSAIDPQTDDLVQVFNPRADVWHEHFVVVGAEIRGLTPIGRATVQLLRFNSPDRIELRLEISRHSGGGVGAE